MNHSLDMPLGLGLVQLLLQLLHFFVLAAHLILHIRHILLTRTTKYMVHSLESLQRASDAGPIAAAAFLLCHPCCHPILQARSNRMATIASVHAV